MRFGSDLSPDILSILIQLGGEKNKLAGNHGEEMICIENCTRDSKRKTFASSETYEDSKTFRGELVYQYCVNGNTQHCSLTDEGVIPRNVFQLSQSLQTYTIFIMHHLI